MSDDVSLRAAVRQALMLALRAGAGEAPDRPARLRRLAAELRVALEQAPSQSDPVPELTHRAIIATELEQALRILLDEG